jgi:hypothetical protein
MPTRSHTTFAKKLEIVEFLKTVLTPKDENGLVSYKVDGMSDTVVAQKLKVTPAIIRGVRQEVLGNLKHMTTTMPNGYSKRLDELEYRIQRIEQGLGLPPHDQSGT